MNMKLLIASLGITGLLLFGCSTPEKVARMKGQGQAKIYNAPYPATWKAAVDSAWGLGLTVLRVYPTEGFISAKRGMTAKTLGEDVGIWVKEAGTGKTQVEVVSRQKGIPVFEIKHWEEDMFHAIGDRLGTAPLAQGGAPGTAAPIRASGFGNTQGAPASGPMTLQPVPSSGGIAQPKLTTIRPTQSQSFSSPAKESQANLNLTKDMILREQLRRYLASKESELKTEKEPARKQLIQGEMDYLHEELDRLDAKLSNVTK